MELIVELFPVNWTAKGSSILYEILIRGQQTCWVQRELPTMPVTTEQQIELKKDYPSVIVPSCGSNHLDININMKLT